jgi:hypothetical protein
VDRNDDFFPKKTREETEKRGANGLVVDDISPAENCVKRADKAVYGCIQVFSLDRRQVDKFDSLIFLAFFTRVPAADIGLNLNALFNEAPTDPVHMVFYASEFGGDPFLTQKCHPEFFTHLNHLF